ncbi:unnamed protein product [Caenorhabditis bovis]|uniref:Uncharacterized protein n=1 Tax=Caenorhabditis bovis TaxID=2654633 RepID=A0A8S1FC05_9PELO|nr:unnamed protein product [Caenorhabditis bovis]
MSNLIRRITTTASSSPVFRRAAGDYVLKCLKGLGVALKAYIVEKTPANLGEVSYKLDKLWQNLFNSDKEIPKAKKCELAEEFLIQPELLNNLLYVFRMVRLSDKAKIRDLFRFTQLWTSNESAESSMPRVKAARFTTCARFGQQLFVVRNEFFEIINEGYDETGSAGIYHDLIEIFVGDDKCLSTIFADTGHNAKGDKVREDGCFWSIFDRLLISSSEMEQHDVLFHTVKTLEMILECSHVTVRMFLRANWDRFQCAMNKLMLSTNFFIQRKSLDIMYNIFINAHYSELRERWMWDMENFRRIVRILQNCRRDVRLAASKIFAIFLEHPNAHPEVGNFVGKNIYRLIEHHLGMVQLHGYDGSQEDVDDAYCARVIHKIAMKRYQRPLTKEEMDSYEEEQEAFEKIEDRE